MMLFFTRDFLGEEGEKMLKRALFFTLVIITMVTLLNACGSDATTTTTAATGTPTTMIPITTTAETATTTVTTQPTTTTPAPTTPATTTPANTTPATTTPENDIDADVKVASKMANFLYNIELVQNYYDDGMTAMAPFQVEATKAGVRAREERAGGTVPQEFLDELPPGGNVPAPAGACPAAAEPAVTFKTEGGDDVTPGMIIEKNLQSVPSEYVTVAQEEANSLVSYIENLVPLGDSRLATAEGWNELLWEKLSALHALAESLMDYQMWNAATEIETDISDLYYQRLIAAGVPQIVLDAYQASNKHGWFANQEATPEDALVRMDIEAEMTGSITGTVYEQRDFSIPGAGMTPIYGTQTGEGIVTWDIPDVGDVEFSVDINLDEFDEQGRAIGGTVIADAIEYEGYQVKFTFKPDGSKDGVLYQDGVEVGYMTMNVNHDKFENYIDIESGTEIALPEDTYPDEGS